jgi:hypothetical protein
LPSRAALSELSDNGDDAPPLADLVHPRMSTMRPPPQFGESATTVRSSFSTCSPLPAPEQPVIAQSGTPVADTRAPLAPLARRPVLRTALQIGGFAVVVAVTCTFAFTLALGHAENPASAAPTEAVVRKAPELPVAKPHEVAAAPKQLAPTVVARPEPAVAPVVVVPEISVQGVAPGAMPIGPGSYGAEIETSRDEPGVLVLRLRPAIGPQPPPP